MTKLIIVQIDEGETRLALLEEGHLAEVFWERGHHKRIAGNIYKGRVENVLPGMQAAFVDIGLARNAFLYVGDAVPLHSLEEGQPQNHPNLSIRDVVKPGQELVVQVLKEGMGSKGPRITSNLTLPGRWVVLMPTVEHIGVSRRIEGDEERRRLREIAENARVHGMGIIVRTAAEGADEAELVADIQRLQRRWQLIQEKSALRPAPSLLHRDFDLVERTLRDLVVGDVEQIKVNDLAMYERMLDWAEEFYPQLRHRIHLDEGKDLWAEFNLQPEIEKALKPKVWLKCGGYLVIDQTEALTVIDVNTGKFVGTNDLAETVCKTNLDAAREIPRQLRLRNIGGIIIIDFIDMWDEAHREQVLQTLQTELRRDTTKTQVLGITQLGLVEMTRKKVSDSVSSVLQVACSYCEGRGRILSEETVFYMLLRELTDWSKRSNAPAVLVNAHPKVAALLIGAGGSQHRDWMQTHHRELLVYGDEKLHLKDYSLASLHHPDEIEVQRKRIQEAKNKYKSQR